jgi:hypothetical protein
MEAAEHDLPFASLPTRKPRTPTEYPTPDFEKFSLSGPSLRLRRNPHPMTRDVRLLALDKDCDGENSAAQ